jgi:hypothetical protein
VDEPVSAVAAEGVKSMDDDEKLLRSAFLAGAITDAAAMVPMLSPQAARLFWGLEDLDVKYRYAMGFGSALMAGWTSLLAWAYRKPGQRRFVALLTIQVILGFVAVEIVAVRKGVIGVPRMVPSWVMQAALTFLLYRGYRKAGAGAGNLEV